MKKAATRAMFRRTTKAGMLQDVQMAYDDGRKRNANVAATYYGEVSTLLDMIENSKIPHALRPLVDGLIDRIRQATA